MDTILFQLVTIIVLTMINAYFAACEMALVSFHHHKMKHLAEEGNEKAKHVLELSQNSTSFLSTIQIVITLSGFLNSASAATGLSQPMADALMQMRIPYADSIAVGVITILISTLTLIFGELVPKAIALNKADEFAMNHVKVIAFFAKICAPFVSFLSFVTHCILKVLNVSETPETSLSKEEMLAMVRDGRMQGVLDHKEAGMMESVITLDKQRASEIMTPRTEMYVIDLNSDLSCLSEQLLTMQYTRVPVYVKTIDNIVGILNMKDYMYEAYHKGFEQIRIEAILRAPYFVPETKNIDDLFCEMQKQRQHIAILVDEFGGVSGMLTIEDIIEEIMGDIEDEFDEQSLLIKVLEDGFLVDGSISLKQLKEVLEIEYESHSETFAGYLLECLGYFPKEKEVVEDENFVYIIEKCDERRIRSVRITRKNV